MRITKKEPTTIKVSNLLPDEQGTGIVSLSRVGTALLSGVETVTLSGDDLATLSEVGSVTLSVVEV